MVGEPTVDRMLCFALYSASRAMTARYRPILDELGLTYPQYLVMVVLAEDGELSVKELGERLRLDSGTLSPLLKRMAAAGLVRKTRDPGDERAVRVTLAEAGVALRPRLREVPGALMGGVDCSDEQVEELRRKVADFLELVGE